MKIMTHQRGFSLIELMVAMGMAAIVMAAIFLSYQAQVQSKIAQEVTLEEQQSGRAGLERIESDLRMAGCNPTGLAGSGFVTADFDEVRVTMDIAGAGATGNESNGAINTADEDIRYAISNGHLVRERFVNNVSVGGEQPIIRNVDALDFVYLNIAGAPIVASGNSVPAASLNLIRSVEITMVIRGAEGNQARGLMRTYTDNTSYENQRGFEILDPQGDDFRRLRLTTTVHCRNMGR
jgi:type IV pilus assembly protein PilW